MCLLQLLHKRLCNPRKELCGLGSRERDVLNEIIGQHVNEILVSAWVELGLISDLCLFESLPTIISLDGEFEMEGYSCDVSNARCGETIIMVDILPFLPV